MRESFPVRRHLTRGLVAFALWIVAPFSLLALAAMAGLLIAMGPLLLFLLVVLPHQWFVRRDQFQAVAVFSTGEALLIALGQWLVVALLYAFLTRRVDPKVHRWLPPLVILAVGILVNAIVTALGVTVEADWL